MHCGNGSHTNTSSIVWDMWLVLVNSPMSRGSARLTNLSLSIRTRRRPAKMEPLKAAKRKCMDEGDCSFKSQRASNDLQLPQLMSSTAIGVTLPDRLSGEPAIKDKRV